MEITSIDPNGQELTIKVSSNEESLFMLLKGYLEEVKGVDIVGVTKDHYLIDKTEFYVRVEKGDAQKIVKDALKTIKKELQSMKLK